MFIKPLANHLDLWVFLRSISILMMIVPLYRPSNAVEALTDPNNLNPLSKFHVSSIFADDEPDESIQTGYDVNYLEFDYVTIDQGLSQNSVLSILQDTKGFMWFGTLDGLNKYDGYEFTTYHSDPDDPFSLSDDAIMSIFESRSGYLWIGTSNGGLNRFDRNSGKFIQYYHDNNDQFSISSDKILTIYEDRSGWLWIGTSGGGLNRFDPSTERFISYQNDLFDSSSLSSNTVTAIYQDSRGTIWIGTEGGGLNQFSPGSLLGEEIYNNRFYRGIPKEVALWEPESFIQYKHIPGLRDSLSNNDIYSIFEDSSGILWIGAGDGKLNRFDRQTESFTQYRLYPDPMVEPRQSAIHAIAEDPSGKLIVGMEYGGLCQFDTISGDATQIGYDPRSADGLNSNNIRSIYYDRSGVLWIGTNGGGLNKLYHPKIKFLSYTNDPTNPNSLSSNAVSSVFEDSNGILWIGTYGGGLNRYNRESGQFIHYFNEENDPNSLSGNLVIEVYEDRSGILWIATDGGLDRFNRMTEEFLHYVDDRANTASLSENNISYIYEDHAGLLWIGTYGGGLSQLDRQTASVSHYNHDPNDPSSLSSDTVHAIIEDKFGMLWIGTSYGLNVYDRETKKFRHYLHDPTDPQSLGDNFVLSLLEDSFGRLWIGTNGGGLDVFDRERQSFSHYRMKDGLIDSVIFGILEDKGGNLWLSTSKGLSRFSPQKVRFDNYELEGGLPNSSIKANAYYKNHRGEMFFGGLGGLIAFYPENIVSDPYVPQVVLTELTQGGKSVAIEDAVENIEELNLRWPNNFFEFEFAALSYINPQKIQYAYMLEGYDKEWNTVDNSRNGRYPNLPEGAYTLRIKASSSDGNWNGESAAVQVSVVPPFWETDGFKAALGVLLVLGVISGYHLRASRAQARNRELEAIVYQRTFEVERRRRVAEGLGEIMVLLNSNKSLEDSLDLIVLRAVQLTSANHAIVYQRADKNSLKLLAGYPEILAGEDLASKLQESLRERVSPFVYGDILLIDPRMGSYNVGGLDGVRLSEKSLLGVPIYVKDEVFGYLVLTTVQERSFKKEDLELVIILADQAALAIGNAQLRDSVQNMAILTERNRLARDLHDAVTQTLFSASLIAESLPSLWENDPTEGRQLLEDLRRLSRGALAEMRTLLLELRPAGLSETNLGDLLRQLAETVTGRTGIPITLKLQGDPELPKNVQVALYRIAQEALNNIEKHSVASHASLILICMDTGLDIKFDQVTLHVEDDGCGFNLDNISNDHLGLAIMQERAQAIGATLNIKSKPGAGTQVKVIWKG